MRRFSCIYLAVLAGGSALLPEVGLLAAEPEVADYFQARCAQCHTVPDPAIRTDLAWLDQVERTAWTGTPKRVRAALIKWLKDAQRVRPTRVDKVSARPKGLALVKTNLKEGSIILVGPESDVALVWKGKRGSRSLPPGRYRLKTTRIARTKGKDHWFLSQTGPPLPPQQLPSDKTTRIDVGDSVHFTPSVQREKGRLQLGFGIRGADGRGLSVYKNDKRVPVTYKLLSKGGRTLASGKMNYGWGGGGWASVKPDPAAVFVEYAIETGPFSLKGKTRIAFRD